MTFSDNIMCRHKDQYITADLCRMPMFKSDAQAETQC